MIEKENFKKKFNKSGLVVSKTTNQLVGSLLAGDKKKRPPVLWLGTNTCAGDSISFLNSLDPGYRAIITDLIDFRYNQFVMTAEGDMCTGVLKETLAKHAGEYILIVEGTVPTRSNGLYCVVGHRNGEPYTALAAVQELGAAAGYVVAVGTCAAFGGPYAAHPNPSHGKSVQEVLTRRVINVPGCPVNPGWIVGTLAHLVWYGEPELDDYNRPTLFYGETIDNLCQRRHYFDSGIFADQLGEPWCMYKVGCKGPVTFADCPYRQWNGEHVNWPVKANTPCIGCVSPEFPEHTMPFFEHLPDIRLPGITVNANRIGAITGTLTALGLGTHLATSVIKGRLPKTIKKGLAPPKLGLEVLQNTPAQKLVDGIKYKLKKRH
ncbi:hydrogenase small subunit [Desulfoscipio gibsoniae]|uniref:Hydrogenase (NiFe) small subunit HydA n=1 Tax=Desulfoscipio gibsoniae DSM 7213 TaxID=767817 RepID=R4KMN7_9FIRM|nr:hydrogenase small subunit [Desulfoscipio gibsoniae]AGL00896.1 hydrogenase (NiFe) small subunit HydA [Desulfoscipio gibsoniae DSM 7213]